MSGRPSRPAGRPARDRKTDEVYTYWGTARATLGLLHTLPAEAPEREPQDGPAQGGLITISGVDWR
jgi:hypothetical protein